MQSLILKEPKQFQLHGKEGKIVYLLLADNALALSLLFDACHIQFSTIAFSNQWNIDLSVDQLCNN